MSDKDEASPSKILSYLIFFALFLPIFFVSQYLTSDSDEDTPVIESAPAQPMASPSNEAPPELLQEPEPEKPVLNVPINKMLVVFSDGASKGCDISKKKAELLGVDSSEISCVNGPSWEHICVNARAAHENFYAMVAERTAVLGGEGLNTDALIHLAKNNKSYDDIFSWNSSESNFRDKCKISFRLRGQYKGSDIDETLNASVWGFVVSNSEGNGAIAFIP